MSCGWARIEKPKPVKFIDIIYQERNLQAKKGKLFAVVEKQNEAAIEDIPTEVLKTISNSTFESDAIIAQIQFENEYVQELKREEENFSQASKVSVFEDYRRPTLHNDYESESEEEVTDIQDRTYCNRFDSLEIELVFIPICGYRIKDYGKMVPKHDIVMNGRRNACRLLSFPLDFQTGDGDLVDLKFNKVFGSLKTYCCKKIKGQKMHNKKELVTAVFGIDQTTLMILYKMTTDQLFEGVNGLVNIGKKAVILHAVLDRRYPKVTEDWPIECAIKVFKPTTSEFKQHDEYSKDHQFKDGLRHQASRKTVELWAQKETDNLMRLKRAGIPCPQVIALKHHVLVMSFIGQDNCAAPNLKDAELDDASLYVAYNEVKNSMKTLFNKANLILADLSEYNILWHDNQCYFIDVSHSVEPTHRKAFRFLHRNCTNIIAFFRKRISRHFIETPNQLFEFITGCEDKIAFKAYNRNLLK